MRKKYCFRTKHTDPTENISSRDYTYFRVETNEYILKFINVQRGSWVKDRGDIGINSNTNRLRLISKVSGATIDVDAYDFYSIPVRKIIESHNKNREIWNLENELRRDFCWNHGDAVIAPLHLMASGTHVYSGSRTFGDDGY